MADDLPPRTPPVDAIATGFAGLTEGIRTDMRAMEERLREDAQGVEKRVTARVEAVEKGQNDTRSLIEVFTRDHGDEHEAEAKDRREAHGTFYEFIRKAELDAARRDGALGMIRYFFELTSRHGSRLVWIILSIGAAAGVATGSIDVNVGGG